VGRKCAINISKDCGGLSMCYEDLICFLDRRMTRVFQGGMSFCGENAELQGRADGSMHFVPV